MLKQNNRGMKIKRFEKKELSNVVEGVDDVDDVGDDDDGSRDVARMTCDGEPHGIEGFLVTNSCQQSGQVT